jgi:hypothetical protein
VTYEFTGVEYQDKFVVEPINYLLIFSMFEEIHIGYWALALEN